MSDFTEDDERFRKEAIKFFIGLIHRRKDKFGIDTRPVNFAGNIGRQMSKSLKKWFLNKYPNNSDYVKFFLENDSVFHYNCITGDVYVNTGANHSFYRPLRLTELEVECTQQSIDLLRMSRNVFELEFLVIVFKEFVDSLNLKKTIELTTRQLAEDLSHQRYQQMFKALTTVVANPVVNTPKFETDLMDYLDTNYSEVFAVDKHRHTIRLQLQVIESLKKVTETLDDTIYKVFEQLLAKFIEKNGPKDVDILFDLIRERHPFILDHIFGHNMTTTEEYTLIDFCSQNHNTFEITLLEDGREGRPQRLVDVRKPVVVPNIKAEVVPNGKPETVVKKADTEMDQIYISDEEEIYSSDDEIYDSDEEKEVIDMRTVNPY